MRKTFLSMLGLMAALTPLRADWKITTVVTYEGHRSVQTEYFKAGLRRYDGDGREGKRYVSVVDKERLRQTIWDLDRREYVVVPLRTQMQKTAVPDSTPRPVLRIEISTTDTGERQTIFGRQARRFISSEKRYRPASSDADRVLESESHIDAWYVDLAGLPANKRAGGVFALLVGGQSPPTIKVDRTGAVPTGLAVWEKITSRQFTSGGESSLSERTVIVTDLFEGSLPEEIFEPPFGFKHVVRFPDDYRPGFGDEIQMYWNRFLNYLRSLFS